MANGDLCDLLSFTLTAGVMGNPSLRRLPRGELLLEWIHDNVRFGICRESDTVDSWYLVSENGTDDCGTLPPGWINWDAIYDAMCTGGDG